MFLFFSPAALMQGWAGLGHAMLQAQIRCLEGAKQGLSDPAAAVRQMIESSRDGRQLTLGATRIAQEHFARGAQLMFGTESLRRDLFGPLMSGLDLSSRTLRIHAQSLSDRRAGYLRQSAEMARD